MVGSFSEGARRTRKTSCVLPSLINDIATSHLKMGKSGIARRTINPSVCTRLLFPADHNSTTNTPECSRKYQSEKSENASIHSPPPLYQSAWYGNPVHGADARQNGITNEDEDSMKSDSSRSLVGVRQEKPKFQRDYCGDAGSVSKCQPFNTVQHSIH